MYEWLCKRFPWLRTPLAVHQRVGDVGGGPLSSSIALAGFLSLFPLLLLGISVVGFVSAGRNDFPQEVIRQLGLTGEAAERVLDTIGKAEDSRRAASVVGLLGLLWAGLGVVGTLEQALNATWQVKGRGLVSRPIGLAWLAGAGVLFLCSLALGPVASSRYPAPPRPHGRGGPGPRHRAVPVDVPHADQRTVGWRDLLPGAIAGGVGLGS